MSKDQKMCAHHAQKKQDDTGPDASESLDIMVFVLVVLTITVWSFKFLQDEFVDPAAKTFLTE